MTRRKEAKANNNQSAATAVSADEKKKSVEFMVSFVQCDFLDVFPRMLSPAIITRTVGRTYPNAPPKMISRNRKHDVVHALKRQDASRCNTWWRAFDAVEYKCARRPQMIAIS